MKLAEYLEKNGITQTEMSKLLGVSQQLIAKYVNNGTVPRKRLMKKLAKVTNNQVTFADFYI
jgi:transcriptional regulator with XRE-family HTH domain